MTFSGYGSSAIRFKPLIFSIAVLPAGIVTAFVLAIVRQDLGLGREMSSALALLRQVNPRLIRKTRP